MKKLYEENGISVYRVRWREFDEEGVRRDREAKVTGHDPARDLRDDMAKREKEQLEARESELEVPFVDGAGTDTPISVAIATWLPTYRKTVSRAHYRLAVKEFQNWIGPELARLKVDTTGELKVRHLEQLRDERPRFDKSPKPPKVATRNKTVAILQAMTRDWAKLGYLDHNISAGKAFRTIEIPYKKKAPIPPVGKLAKACDALDEAYAEGDWTPSDIIWLLALGAFRVSEGRGLAPEHVLHEQHLIEVHRKRLRNDKEACINHPDETKRKGKTKGAFREVTADKLLLGHAERLTRFCQPIECECCGTMTGGRLICWPDGTPMGYAQLDDRWRRACGLAGVPVIPLGELRHFGVARAIKAGVGPYRVMKLAGHTKIETTLNDYAGLWPNDHAEVAALLTEFGLGNDAR